MKFGDPGENPVAQGTAPPLLVFVMEAEVGRRCPQF